MSTDQIVKRSDICSWLAIYAALTEDARIQVVINASGGDSRCVAYSADARFGVDCRVESVNG